MALPLDVERLCNEKLTKLLDGYRSYSNYCRCTWEIDETSSLPLPRRYTGLTIQKHASTEVIGILNLALKTQRSRISNSMAGSHPYCSWLSCCLSFVGMSFQLCIHLSKRKPKTHENWTRNCCLAGENVCLYCWCLKSCTSWYGKYPVIYTVFYITGGARFLPSTVVFSCIFHIFLGICLL